MCEIFSALVSEPYCLTIEEIGNLTPYQVRNLYFREKEEEATEIPWFMKNQGGPGEAPKNEEKDLFWKVNKEWRNMSEEKVQDLWNKQEETKKPKPKQKPKSNLDSNPYPNPLKKEQPNGTIKT
jgi:hypothetical protein